MIRPISLGTRLGFGAPCAELPLPPFVVDVGPARSPAVFDAWLAGPAVCAAWLGAPGAVLEAALLLVAAEAELSPPLQAVAARRIKTRIYRYIFPNCCKR